VCVHLDAALRNESVSKNCSRSQKLGEAERRVGWGPKNDAFSGRGGACRPEKTSEEREQRMLLTL
jgi:hypothetical protein